MKELAGGSVPIHWVNRGSRLILIQIADESNYYEKAALLRIIIQSEQSGTPRPDRLLRFRARVEIKEQSIHEHRSHS